MNKETKKEYKAYLWKRWLLDVLIRTIKTGCETAAGMITVGLLWTDIDWIHVISVTGVAMVYTVLMNFYKILQDLEDARSVENSVESGEK